MEIHGSRYAALEKCRLKDSQWSQVTWWRNFSKRSRFATVDRRQHLWWKANVLAHTSKINTIMIRLEASLPDELSDRCRLKRCSNAEIRSVQPWIPAGARIARKWNHSLGVDVEAQVARCCWSIVSCPPGFGRGTGDFSTGNDELSVVTPKHTSEMAEKVSYDPLYWLAEVPEVFTIYEIRQCCRTKSLNLMMSTARYRTASLRNSDDDWWTKAAGTIVNL